MSGVATAIVAGAVVGAGASYLAAGEQADASTQAANTQAGANRYAADLQAQATAEAARLQRESAQESNALQKEMYYKNIELQQPWLTAGQNALARIQAGEYGLPESFKTPAEYALPETFKYTAEDFAKGQDPGYAFRLKEGLKALDRTASARGGMLSGGALKAAAQYGQEMGSQEFGNAYNRALTEYNSKVNRATAGYSRALDEYNAAVGRSTTGYNRLAGLANVGQSTANQIGGAGSTLATNVGNTLTNSAANIGNLTTAGAANIGNLYSASGTAQANALLAGGQARASAYQGLGSSIGQGIGSYLNYSQNRALINALNNQNSGYITNTQYTTTAQLGEVTALPY